MKPGTPEDPLLRLLHEPVTTSPPDLTAGRPTLQQSPPQALGEHQLSIPFLFALVSVGCSPGNPRAVYSGETTPPCAAAGLNRAPIPIPKPTSGRRMLSSTL